MKNGRIKGIQRCKRKDCGCNYTVGKRSGEYAKETKWKAFQLYLEGLNYRQGKLILFLTKTLDL